MIVRRSNRLYPYLKCLKPVVFGFPPIVLGLFSLFNLTNGSSCGAKDRHLSGLRITAFTVTRRQ
ncbi:hypothetical protein [Anaerocolumna sp. MB42-C2]|uniref:hypothetical protein n=1 Tax=Anaerocolumna sp. MB42-C2 TaxID=3070997 RepID=UPI0027E1C6CA|nr:hypothetical protein [Anaerocolumna sp. MB42-C2]WMJ90175.1 hypothetical protein RBU59_11805 [Anaerocolumna sp. MB42-C2]